MLPARQERPRGKRIFADASRRFRKPTLPRQIFRIELRKPLPAEQRVFVTVRRRKQLRRLAVLLNRFVRMILSLLQEGVSSDTFRRLPTAHTQKPGVNGERLGVLLWFHEHVKTKSVEKP